MTHKATKNHRGNYTYRGYTIEHSHQDAVVCYGKSATWQISIWSDDDAVLLLREHSATLTQAKIDIDFWLDDLGIEQYTGATYVPKDNNQ